MVVKELSEKRTRNHTDSGFVFFMNEVIYS